MDKSSFSPKNSNHSKEINNSVDINNSQENQIEKAKTCFQSTCMKKDEINLQVVDRFSFSERVPTFHIKQQDKGNLSLNYNSEMNKYFDDVSVFKNNYQRNDNESSYHSDKNFPEEKNCNDNHGFTDMYTKNIRAFNNTMFADDCKCNNTDVNIYVTGEHSVFKLDSKHSVENAYFTIPDSNKFNDEGHENNNSSKNCNANDTSDFNSSNLNKLVHRSMNPQTNEQPFLDQNIYCSSILELSNSCQNKRSLKNNQEDYVNLSSDDSVVSSAKQRNSVHKGENEVFNKYMRKDGDFKNSSNTRNDSKFVPKSMQNSFTDIQMNPSYIQFYSDARALDAGSSNNSSELDLKTLNFDISNSLATVYEFKEAKEEFLDFKDIPRVKDVGFFVHVSVSQNSNNLKMWQNFFKNLLKIDNFNVDTCCKFTESMILSFQDKADSLKAYCILSNSKKKKKDIRKSHVVSFSRVKYHILKPCTCEKEIIANAQNYFKKFSEIYIVQHKYKMSEIVDELRSINSKQADKFIKEYRAGLKDALNTLEDMKCVFNKYVEDVLTKVKKICSLSDLRKMKIDFSRECNSFARCLPVYSRKDVILDTIRHHQVSIIVAETGSGKSTQLVEYLLQSVFVNEGTIICTQPRKLAAISITQFVSGQIGSAVGKEIGYDVGIEKKYIPTTKIIYMTDSALLRKCLRNRTLKGVSCVIIDEAHERTLYTDLLLGLLKQCFPSRPDLRVVITSATIDPSVFVDYFNLPSSAVVNVPGRVYPVEVIWLKDDVNDNFRYVEECVKAAVEVHLHETKGDILVFLTSPAEIDEAILLFKEMCYEEDMPQLLSLHGKSDIHEQLLVFQANSNQTRRIIFATNSAETSLTIPGIKYVIDSGMTKEMLFYPEKNKSCLIPKFINKSSAEQRKGRAGRTQPGICYRLYSKKSYENMPERSLPEILKTSLLRALLKIYEFGIKPDKFDFVEAPSKEAISRSLASLEILGLVKDDKLTKLGRQVMQLSIDPHLAKFILSGVEYGIGHEAAIIASLVSEAGRLFIRFDDNKIVADERKKVFCQESGDLCTYLEVYKRWLEVSKSDRFDWCVANYVSSKALTSASKTVKEIIMSLRLDLDIPVSRRYNNVAFKNNFEQILFNSFSENLCVFSGHPNVGYFSPYFKESLFIHPSSSLKHLRKAFPKFLVYTTLMETSRNFILDVTPLKEETINKAYLNGTFTLTIDAIMKMQILPLVLGPFGEKVLFRHIIGKGGSAITNLEHLIERIAKTRNFRLDIDRDMGQIIVYVESRFHRKISNIIHGVVDQALVIMAKEEKVINMKEGLCDISLSTGGIIHDIIMPGEFRKFTLEIPDKKQLEELEPLLESIGTVQSINYSSKAVEGNFLVSATYRTVAEAQKAFVAFSKKKINIRAECENQKMVKPAKPIYRLKLSWPRLLCKGTGWISFSCKEDCITLLDKLTSTSICIDNKIITIEPSRYCKTELNVKNLSRFTDEKMLKEAFNKSLPSVLSVLIKDVSVNRVENQPVVESDMTIIRTQLMRLFCHFTSNKVSVDIMPPRHFDKTWIAWAAFENLKDAVRSFQQLKDKIKLNSIPVQLMEVLESEIQCKKYVYEFLKNDIINLILEQGGKLINEEMYSCQFNCNEEKILIKFSSQTIEKLCITREKILKLIDGLKIECFGKRKYFYLFTEIGKKKLMEVQKVTNTCIHSITESKVIFIYGSQKNCCQAEAKIHDFIAESKLSNTKIFDLKNFKMPTGFLRHLYEKYEMDLFYLIKKFNLLDARIDSKIGRLIIKGQNSVLKVVEDHLENICVDLYKKNPIKSLQDGTENCGICLDPINFDFYRLENCGHSFCKLCLTLQLESKSIPVLCTHENCGKEFLLIDIEKILLFGGKNFEQDFLDAAIQYHIKTNPGKVSYCPTPDCHSVYRVSNKSGSEFFCSGCSNGICTYCQSYSHKGMSCDRFQNLMVDEV